MFGICRKSYSSEILDSGWAGIPSNRMIHEYRSPMRLDPPCISLGSRVENRNLLIPRSVNNEGECGNASGYIDSLHKNDLRRKNVERGNIDIARSCMMKLTKPAGHFASVFDNITII